METLELLQKLIQIPSLSGRERKLAEFIMDFCSKFNLPYEIVKGNIVVYFRGKKSDKALIFNAHMDTVDYGNRKSWEYPPIGEKSGKFIDGKIFGLGSSDDKGAITSMLLVTKSFAENIPPHDLWFVLVKNEETDGSGSKNFLKWFKKKGYLKKYKSIGAIIGEPTGLTNIEIGHRGNVFITLTTYGITGHGAEAYPPEDLAIEKMLSALMKLKSVFPKWSEKYSDKILGQPTMNITFLSTSINSVNKIPDKCFANLDIRTTPGLHNVIETLLKKELGDKVSVSKLKEFYPPKLAGKKSRIVKLCKKVIPDYSFSVALGTNDLGQFLDFGIDAVVLGPGQKSVIHKDNEYIELSQIEKAITLYKKIINLW